MVYALSIGGLALVVSAIFLGAWTSGDQQRANFNSETEHDRDFRTRVGLWSGGIAVLSFGIEGIIYLITK
ncbi:DUF5316 family protein [Peribacillus alkalitolerans]|uniref:DUF5316 family protein n=1 Tax=Peribacillus alkalitolerans TaxID=1550385 RepID=UPI0013D8CAE8|nr:DUF5316 family protein [Peribacillus alkalitolerans]